ncbi:ethanolamine ammonia-lyase subunit EutC [Granulicella arctica]|uniref:Ethanolamine ammonia-lyase small subunit n=1 Tax=Granulicella arctica TaxID=940613 RepID=A0A7Y9THM2_9BACT|nr:ethanolamine ammonia-lyase small subunit [Granulicella arctica]
MSSELALPDPWHHLSKWTAARIALGRVGASTPTRAVLDFTMDHARARDAIQTALQVDKLDKELDDRGFRSLRARSRAHDRAEYLRRPDLGRMLAPECLVQLENPQTQTRLLTIVIADGLSALAPMQHALPLVEMLREALSSWVLDSIVLATQARVALADEIGQVRGAEATIILIGERPGLKSADSLGAYLTYHPRPGRTDAERNCVSNIRPAGLSYAHAALKLLHLLEGARTLSRSGVDLKDESDANWIPRLATDRPNHDR